MGFLSQIRDIWVKHRYREELPDNYTSSDIFLVSYPKSGNTFLRFLISNAVKVHFEKKVDVNWFTIHQIIPDIHVSTAIPQQGPFGVPSLPRIIKSHSCYNPFYKNVILLVRDPRDVVVSYFNYKKSQGNLGAEVELAEFVRDPEKVIQAWTEHTESWLSEYRSGQNIRYYKFEDLVKDTEDTLTEITELLGLNLSSGEIEEVVRLCSKERMRALERTTRPSAAVEDHGKKFVRKGEVTRGGDLNESEEEYILKKAGDMMEKLGYKVG